MKLALPMGGKTMNPMLPMVEPVIRDTHNERLKRAERARLIKEIRSNYGNAPGVRARLGMALMRTGARLVPDGERKIELGQYEKNAA